jgi:hypothetical protein
LIEKLEHIFSPAPERVKVHYLHHYFSGIHRGCQPVPPKLLHRASGKGSGEFQPSFWIGLGIAGHNAALHSSTDIKITAHDSPYWLAGVHDIPQNPVDGILVKNAKVSESQNVSLDSFQLKT